VFNTVHGFFIFDIMSFANSYISKNNRLFFFEAPVELAATEMVVVIPCYNEPELSATLQSLFEANNPNCQTTVLVVVNDSDESSDEVTFQNCKTIEELSLLKSTAPQWISLQFIYANHLPQKWAGAGWARKIGMDWAITHFNQHTNENGIIISLDADCVVDKNYFTSIFDFFDKQHNSIAATLYFEHRTNEPQPQIAEAITLYEIYMRYYKLALQSTGFPWAIYTVGSCFAVKAKAYVAQGGMNRRKAGEDFYFLNKLLQYGHIGEINCTCVRPSARVSNRVPFGTGPALANHLNGSSSLLATYPLAAFDVLVELFTNIDNIYQMGENLQSKHLSCNPVFMQFAEGTFLTDELKLLASNCSNILIFRKRFFHIFDAFRVLKWLNFASTKNYPKSDLLLEVHKLLKKLIANDSKLSVDISELLNTLRNIDRR